MKPPWPESWPALHTGWVKSRDISVAPPLAKVRIWHTWQLTWPAACRFRVALLCGVAV
jgi:hypothetical protein